MTIFHNDEQPSNALSCIYVSPVKYCNSAKDMILVSPLNVLPSVFTAVASS